jgi:preprotein translocase subunit YajC
MHLNVLNALLADATPAAPAPATTPAGTPGAQPAPTPLQLFSSPLTLIVLMVVLMYFMIFRPQSQQRKRQAQMLETLRSGDRVVTASGIVGVIVAVKDKTLSLRSADAKMEVTKSSVTEILERGGEEKSAA